MRGPALSFVIALRFFRRFSEFGVLPLPLPAEYDAFEIKLKRWMIRGV
jgi:hypothetical protein